jgi:2-amino-4-hydroxy-6-hydroxymethyldihydropteridine diphosphokinase
MGRQREMTKYEARIIDIDILFFGEEIFRNSELQIPHPYLHFRKFILVPLNELMPALIHPVLKKEIRQILAECPDRSVVRRIS